MQTMTETNVGRRNLITNYECRVTNGKGCTQLNYFFYFGIQPLLSWCVIFLNNI